ncbi:MAG: hypothetical protein H7338_19355 [Candidatus Sericytochromatia bacterium]|nr:hypothetical protein [Candidatus Sericytochromatia bacterium]
MPMITEATTKTATSFMPSARSEAGASIVARYHLPGFAHATDDTLNGRLTALMTKCSAGILSNKDSRVARHTQAQQQVLANRGIL